MPKNKLEEVIFTFIMATCMVYGMIEKECVMSLNGIMETLFELHGSAKPGLYGRINEAIVVAL